MRMLGEMAVANPQVGSFAEYARRSLGAVGGLRRRLALLVLLGRSCSRSRRWRARRSSRLAPACRCGLMALVLMVAADRRPTSRRCKSFGEFEFWFAVDQGRGDRRLHRHRASATCSASAAATRPACRTSRATAASSPEGGVAILSGIVIVIFAFVGAEIVTIAAAESEEPEQAVTRATNAVDLRVLTFYVLAVFLIVCDPAVERRRSSASRRSSPRSSEIGIPGAADSHERGRRDRGALVPELRHLHRLAHAVRARPPRRRAEGMLDVNGRGVPVRAILLDASIGFLSVILDVDLARQGVPVPASTRPARSRCSSTC